MNRGKPRRFKARHGDLRFVIDRLDSPGGCHLHVYNNGDCIGDHLVATLESAKRVAGESYDVPEDDWEEE